MSLFKAFLGLSLVCASHLWGQAKTIDDAATGRQLRAVELKTKRADCRVGDGRVWIVMDRAPAGPQAMVSVWVFRAPLGIGDPPIVIRGDSTELLVVGDSGRWQRAGSKLAFAPAFQFHETVGNQEHAVYGLSLPGLDTLVTLLERDEPALVRVQGTSGHCDLRVVPERTDLLREMMMWAKAGS